MQRNAATPEHSTGPSPFERKPTSRLVIACVVALSLVALIGSGFLAGNSAIERAKRGLAMDLSSRIERGISSFHTSYRKLPTSSLLIDTATDTSLAKTLTGKDRATNPGGTWFLSIHTARRGRSGLDPMTDQIFDPWGRGFIIVPDTDGDGRITVIRGSITNTVTGKQVAIYSKGKDGIPGTEEDVISW